jgi:DNA-binding LacI/PurR family transcriptional regulator
MEEAGQKVPGRWTMAGGYGIENGFDAGERLLGVQKRPTAIFAANDNIALGIMAAAHRHNLWIGSDLSLVGYNDTLRTVSPYMTRLSIIVKGRGRIQWIRPLPVLTL